MMRPGFTGSPLDRADTLRNDPDAFAAACADWRARLLRLDGIDPVLDADGRLSWDSLAEAGDQTELLLLGLIDGRPHFAALDYSMPEGAARSPAIFGLLDMMPGAEASTYAGARSLIDWHLRHRFCAKCGNDDTVIHRAGWGRKCGRCGAEHFPRVDPVVIMLAEHDGKVLVGRQYRYPPGRYSALAGFVEPGESVEEAVARELHEEAGLKVRDVRYIVSQPWPFPSSLMMACMATADDPTLTIDKTELEDAIWVDRAGVAAAMAREAGAPFLPPPHYAIAHTLFRWWLEETGFGDTPLDFARDER
jgi:NAD+ diphosphatase